MGDADIHRVLQAGARGYLLKDVWMSEDEHRMIVQMKSQLSFGSINLYLKSVGRP